MEWYEKEMYVVTLDQERRNISDIIAHKYMDDCFKGCELDGYQRQLINEVFRYILVKKGGVFWKRHDEYREAGLQATDRFIKHTGFSNDYEGVLIHMRNFLRVKQLKDIIIGKHPLTKVIWHIMRLIYLTPKFTGIMETELKFKRKK